MARFISSAAAKLITEGITKNNYTKELAKEIFSRCCGAVVLIQLLETKETEIIELLN